MVPSHKEIEQLLKKYAPNDELFQRVYTHGQIVAEIALWCADNAKVEVNKNLLEAACLLHDIGSYIFLSSKDEEKRAYPQHALFGAMILREEGIDKQIYEAVRTHVLLGLTKADIEQGNWALPHKDFLPQTEEAKLLCYADRYHSKGPDFNTYEYFYEGLKSVLPGQAEKFKAWSEIYGVPDIAALAHKYGHPVR